MPKRPSHENPRERKGSEDMTDPESKKPVKKKGRYNLRNRKKTDGDDTEWVYDDTLDDSDEEELTIEFTEEEDEPDSQDDFLSYLANKYVQKTLLGSIPIFQTEPKKQTKEKGKEIIPIHLTRDETAFYKKQSDSKRKELLDLMNRISKLSTEDSEIPTKFKILQLPVSDNIKSQVIKKLNTLEQMGNDSGESYKLRTWLDAFLRIPFGRTIPLPVKIEDGKEKCTDFMVNARKIMDSEIYGMIPAKTQIMQVIAQWIVNPDSVGNVIALQGPMGVGKTAFARNAIAKVLQRPFEFFTLGGASDISNFVGHSYTYEGSMWGRIADSLMNAGTMNPVLYFDELDKISTTPQGEEIVNMMIHLTDRSQNTQFHDRYFSGVDLDLSQCLFVFSLNDIDKVHPILRDRMTIIHCNGYNENDKKIILKNHIWKQLISRLRFIESEIILKDSAIEYMISEYSKDEKGVRNLIRGVETLMTRLNMLRISNHESMKDYGFFMEITNPVVIDETVVKKLLFDYTKKESESWKSMYT